MFVTQEKTVFVYHGKYFGPSSFRPGSKSDYILHFSQDRNHYYVALLTGEFEIFQTLRKIPDLSHTHRIEKIGCFAIVLF